MSSLSDVCVVAHCYGQHKTGSNRVPLENVLRKVCSNAFIKRIHWANTCFQNCMLSFPPSSFKDKTKQLKFCSRNPFYRPTFHRKYFIRNFQKHGRRDVSFVILDSTVPNLCTYQKFPVNFLTLNIWDSTYHRSDATSIKNYLLIIVTVEDTILQPERNNII